MPQIVDFDPFADDIPRAADGTPHINIGGGTEVDFDPFAGAPPTLTPGQQATAQLRANANQSNDPADIALALQAENQDAQPAFMPKTDRVVRGLGDPYRAIAQIGAHVLPGVDANAFDQSLATGEQAYQDKRKAAGLTGADLLRTAGMIAGSAPLMAGLPAGESLLGTTGYGALTGAIGGASQPVYDPNGNFWQKKGMDTGIGAVAGAGVGAATHIAGRMINPQPSENLRYLQERGVHPTIGQNLGPGAAKAEDILGSFNPLVAHGQRMANEDFNRAAYNEVLAPLGATYNGPVGRDAVRAVGDHLSDAYDALVPNLSLVPDAQFHADLAAAQGLTRRMSTQAADQFDRIMTDALPQGPLAGQGLRDVQSKLTHEIARFGRSPDPSHQMISEALEGVRDAVNNNLARVTPQYADQLNAINSGWANLVRVEKAATGARDGIFTPGQLLSAVKGADNSVRKRAVARGTALMQDLADAGVDVLGNRYPDSGTPGRLIGASILGGGAATVASAHPVGVAAGVLGSGLYLNPVQRFVSNLFMPRGGAVAPLMGDAVRSAGPLLGGAVASGGTSLMNQ